LTIEQPTFDTKVSDFLSRPAWLMREEVATIVLELIANLTSHAYLHFD